MICFYHSRDLDGYTGGFIVKQRYPEAILIGYDYGKPFPWDKIPKGEPVIMIDVSLSMTDMLKLAMHSTKFTWIDHHISAIKEFEATSWPTPEMTAVLQDGISACEGGWNYLFPDKSMPEAIKLLGEYDTWRNKDKDRWENRILPFQFGMRMLCNSPETFPTSVIYHEDALDNIEEIITNGRTILDYQAQVNERACHSSFEFNFEGLRAICLNGGGFNSDVFKSVYDPEKHDIMMPFQFNGKFWTVSLYTTHDHIDCSMIAKSKGGGGHKKAAGFQTNDLKFLGL